MMQRYTVVKIGVLKTQNSLRAISYTGFDLIPLLNKKFRGQLKIIILGASLINDTYHKMHCNYYHETNFSINCSMFHFQSQCQLEKYNKFKPISIVYWQLVFCNTPAHYCINMFEINSESIANNIIYTSEKQKHYITKIVQIDMVNMYQPVSASKNCIS